MRISPGTDFSQAFAGRNRGHRRLGFQALLLGLGLVAGVGEARAQPPEKTRGWVDLAFISSIQGPLGPGAFALAVLPLPRLAVGTAFGYSSSQKIWGHDDDPRPALFARYDVLSLQRFRLGLGVMYSTGSYYWPGHTYWHRGGRLDGTVSVDWVHGNWSLRLEGGVGRMLKDPEHSSYAPAGSPPHWLPNLQLAISVRPGERQADSATPASASPNLLRILAAGTSAVAGSPGCGDSGGCSYEARTTVGLEADFLHQISTHWRLGGGGRLDIGHGVSESHDEGRTAVIGFIPFLLAPFYRWDQTGEEVELAFGFGMSLGSMQTGDSPAGMSGLGAEASLSYSRPINGSLSLVVGVAARAIVSRQRNGLGTYASIPLRLGVRW